MRALVPDLAALVALTPAELEAQIGADKAAAVIAFLRANPDALTAEPGGSIASTLARDRLARKPRRLRARRSRRGRAGSLCRPISTASSRSKRCSPTRDGGADAARRAGHGRLPQRHRSRREPKPQLRQRLAATEALLDEAEAALAPEAESDIATFLGAFAILLREGLEALLVVIAMIAFLRKAERTEALPYVHGGWVAALVAGAATWAAAHLCDRHQRREPRADRGLRLAARRGDPAVGRHLDARQGAGRRMAALHRRQDAGRLVARLGLVPVRLSPSSSSIARCSRPSCSTPRCGRRTMATTILAGAADGRRAAWRSLPGPCCATAETLPITEFFRYSAILIAILAVVLAGKGVGALQEAGIVRRHSARRRAAHRRCSACSRR